MSPSGSTAAFTPQAAVGVLAIDGVTAKRLGHEIEFRELRDAAD